MKQRLKRPSRLPCLLLVAASSLCGLSQQPGLSSELDISTRGASFQFYRQEYLSSENIPISWTGNHTDCDPGETAREYREAVLRRVGYFRAMAGIPGVVALNDVWSAKAQQAAQIMSVNDAVTHSPSPSCDCYSSGGAMAAQNSNLALGVRGPDAIDAYMWEPGVSNAPVGHRRLILDPSVNEMGTGDIPAASPKLASNALWVLDKDSVASPPPITRDLFIAWPPPGYVPFQVTYPRWSFSYPDANFTEASVSMTRNGEPIPSSPEPVATGFGENTLVWLADGMSSTDRWPRPLTDDEYRVSIGNVLIDGTATSFSYRVTVFDADVLVGDYNFDRQLNAADYAVWRDTQSQTGEYLPADGDKNGVVDQLDYDLWARNYGASFSPLMASPYPHPAPETSCLLLLVAGASLGALSCNRPTRCVCWCTQ